VWRRRPWTCSNRETDLLAREPMDTRTKILGWPEAEQVLGRRRDDAPLTVVTGYFDPLLAGHARRLAEIARTGNTVAVVLASPPRPLLAAPARAELVAALAAVRYVILPPDEGAEAVLQALHADRVVREESSDARRAGDLIRYVRERHAASRA